MRKAVNIPLIGNGDVRSGRDALRMFLETGCDGVMVGRAAISNPWKLRDIIAEVCGNAQGGEPSLEERVSTALLHLRLMIEDVGDEISAVRALRGQLPLYIKGVPGAAAVRNELVRIETYSDAEEILNGFAAGVTSRACIPAR